MTGHRIFTLAALTLLAVACNREAIFPEEGREEVIDFSAFFAQDATKAVGEINDIGDFAELGLPDSIGVFACYTGEMEYDLTSVSPDFMYNQKVTYEGGNWTYSPVKYWPNNASEKISFFSYYPYISSENALEAKDGIIGFSKSNAKGDPWLVYKLPKKAPYTQTDLMYGVPQTNIHKPAVSEKIEFPLKHALACMADTVTVKMSSELYQKMHDSLDISITGLRIVYSNLTNKARLVLNSDEEPIWKEVISGELQTSRTYEQDIVNKKFSKDISVAKADTVLTIVEGMGLFYIPLQIEGQPAPEVRITLSYEVNGLKDHGTFADSVVTVKQFTPGNPGKKQNLALTLTKDFNLDADIITEVNGISMPDDLEARYEDVKIDYEITDTLTFIPVADSSSVQKYVVPRTGTYTLQAWGAKGGRGADQSGGEGANGGYATAQFKLSIGDTLYVYVGGMGGNSESDYHTGGKGGWNGGAGGGFSEAGGYSGGGGGGGATHIAMSNIGHIAKWSSTKLSDHVGTVGHLLLVAGGGGGGSHSVRVPGAGGGTKGTPGYWTTADNWNNGVYSYGATGGNGTNDSDCQQGNGGGGGGYIGGSAKASNSIPSSGGSGGSSNANTARYNYVGSFETIDGASSDYPKPKQVETTGNGLVVITFVNELL
jgi:hypothetical protein